MKIWLTLADEGYRIIRADAERIVKAITSGSFATYGEAMQAIVAFWIPDLSVSRAGIALAMNRLEQHYRRQE